jgi:hypothetical protein
LKNHLTGKRRNNSKALKDDEHHHHHNLPQVEDGEEGVESEEEEEAGKAVGVEEKGPAYCGVEGCFGWEVKEGQVRLIRAVGIRTKVLGRIGESLELQALIIWPACKEKN